MAKRYKKGLDGRQRDRKGAKAGQIREKRGDTLVATLRKEYGPGFAPGVSGRTKLGALRKRTGKSLHQLLKKR
ncbi:MAG: hypothetical protein ACLPJH_19335 [Myxococcaceae bacterium]